MEKSNKAAETWFYSHISDKPSARKAAKSGIWASLFCAGVTVLVVVINAAGAGILDIGPLSLIDAGIFGIIAYYISRMSRTAAVIGLIVYLLERLSMMDSGGGFRSPLVMIIIILLYINSIRGTFAYHKYELAEQAQAADTPQSSISNI